VRSLYQDFRYGCRTLIKSPGFSLVAVVTLALGIGANSTIFSWINSTLLNPIPGVTNAGSLVTLSGSEDPESPRDFSYPDAVDLRDKSHTFSSLTFFDTRPMDLSRDGKPERTWGSLVTANFFDVLGIRPILGRGFLPEEDQKPGGAPVVVISYRLWQTHFGADSTVVGKTISINRRPFTIVGVAPALFQGSQTGLRSEMWIPLMMQRPLVSDDDWLHGRSTTWLIPMGRLKPGVSLAQAQQEMDLLMRQLVEQYPESHKGRNQIALFPLWRGPFGANGYFYVLLPILMAIAGVVLLLACANVANLLLVRSVARRRELAVRLSMGANRWRLVRQLLVESLMLALPGGVLAVLITTWTARTFTKFIPPTNLPISLDVSVDQSVLLATLGISIFTGIAFGILPALRASSLSPLAVLKEESGNASSGPRKSRLSSGLVVAQISLSLFLLICAGLFVRTFRNAQHFDPGFNQYNVYVGSLDLFPAGYKRATGTEFERQLLTRLEALPGVQSVALANWIPLGFSWNTTFIQPEGYVPQPHESMDTGENVVSPGYFRTLQIPLLAGRDFREQDTEGSQGVAIVNQALAERYWPKQDALGKRIHADDRWYSVVGVARNSTYAELGEEAQPFIYVPLYQEYTNRVIIHARVAGDPMILAPMIEKKIHELNAELPVFEVSTLDSRVQVASTTPRIAATFVGAFGLIALALAAVGIYGVIAYTTRQRTREIGIRMALGAQRIQVLKFVLGQGLRLTVTGLAVGVVLSLVTTRFLSSLLFGVSATDVLTFLIVAVVLTSVSLAACYVPARRATRVDPMVVLRYE
jgi:predicted permease